MNLFDSYRYLAALAQHRHFGRAAAACHITQPALSNALRTLEAELGVVIVRRGRQFEGFTAEGEQVLATARELLHAQERLQQQLAGSADQPQGRLAIGCVPTALPIAARFVARLIERHPGLRPQLRSLASQELEDGLERLALDLALGYTERVAVHARLQAWPLIDEQYHLVQRAAQPAAALQRGPALAWAEAAARPLALLSPEMHNRAILDRVFAGLGLAVQPALETDSVLALLVAVEAGSVDAVLPGALVATVRSHGALQARPLAEPVLRTPLGFITAPQRPASRALHAALDLAQGEAWQAEARAHSGALDGSP